MGKQDISKVGLIYSMILIDEDPALMFGKF